MANAREGDNVRAIGNRAGDGAGAPSGRGWQTAVAMVIPNGARVADGLRGGNPNVSGRPASGGSGTLPGMKIARVESFRVVAQRDYEGSAGLRAATVEASGSSRPRALARNDGRHLCVYPAQAEVLLVRIVTDDGLVGWGEAHSPPIPRVAQALITDLFAPQLIGRDPLAIDAIWDALYASMRLRGYGTGVMLEAIAGGSGRQGAWATGLPAAWWPLFDAHSVLLVWSAWGDGG
ncbi:MAG: hypothetical protein EBS94_08160 [Proteobacteria bacterium]|nr:hypothetical protein [Pseudomonadota bacterium]